MREHLKNARKAAVPTHQAMADKMEAAADNLLIVLENVCMKNSGDEDGMKFLQKFLIAFDAEYCDILSSFRIHSK